MDYEVFLLTRIREAYLESHDNRESVAQGLERSGRIITSAAAIIVLVSAVVCRGGYHPHQSTGPGHRHRGVP